MLEKFYLTENLKHIGKLIVYGGIKIHFELEIDSLYLSDSNIHSIYELVRKLRYEFGQRIVAFPDRINFCPTTMLLVVY